MNRGAWLLIAALLVLPFSQQTSAQLTGNGGYDSPYLQADMIQELSDWTSTVVNPALLYRVNQFYASFGMYRWALDQGQPPGFQNESFIFPIRRNQTVGFTHLWVSSMIDGRRITAATYPGYDTLGQLPYSDNWLIGSYAVRLPNLPWLSLGGNLKYRIVHEFDQGIKAANWPGLDIGAYLNPFDHYRFGDLGLSLMFQDIWPVTVDWESNGEPTVTRLRFGVRYALFNDALIADIEPMVDNIFAKLVNAYGLLNDYKGNLTQAQIDSLKGNPNLFNVSWRFSAHFEYQFIPQLWLKFGWNSNNIPYIGFNANLIYPLPEMINYLNFDCNFGYSFLEDLSNTSSVGGDERGLTWAWKISTDFGPTREQRESKRLYDQLLIAPMDAYNEAMRLYSAQRYWDASFAFGKVLSLFPNFNLNDKATWCLGNCYRFLQMNSIARETYKDALEEFTTSEMRAKYLYGLEVLDYKEGKFDDALKNHAFIINLYPDNDIRPDADYVAGQIHFERKNYNVAEQLLTGIKPKENPYLYAQYTLSIINIENEKVPAALQNLQNVVADTTSDPAKQLIQDAANLKMGHAYFEQGDQLRKAVEAYQRVPEGSQYGDEALLGTAWAWIKVNKPDICLQTVDRLVSTHPESPLIPESYLVRGYALMLSKRYSEAVPALEKCIALTKGSFVTQADLQTKKSDYDRVVQDFIPTAEKVRKNALRKPTNKTAEERPEMKTAYDQFAKQDIDFFAFQLLAKSHTKFFKQKDKIVEDAEYALAKATNLSKKAGGALPTQNQKQEKIDQELEKAKQELQKLQK